MQKLYNHPEVLNKSSFLESIEKLAVDDKPEDIFTKSFYAWIKSKALKQPLYKTTLELVNKS